MLLSDGDRRVIIGALQWAAMEHDKISKYFTMTGDKQNARLAGAMSVECARLADLLQKGA